MFSLLGFVVSAMWISAAASEVVSILHMLGVVLSLSNNLLGLTLLAWGNSIGGETHTHCGYRCTHLLNIQKTDKLLTYCSVESVCFGS